MPQHSNRLANESSPYLLQHANNPINWYPWGEEAFAKAKEENKLMLISIGYSSCHWCHVMEREAFSNPEVSEFMNTHYVCVKVDREERPDVDQIYMNAIQIISRSGGWPLNCFALPDGRPVYGGTYYPVDAWLDTLKSLHFTWISEPKRVEQVADELMEGIAQTEIITSKALSESTYSETLFSLISNWQRHFDERYGGLKGAPKFAMPESLRFLFSYAWAYSDAHVLAHVENTLQKMALSGIYDHLGGGFFRYSVDEMWHVPHFEKMLYDNALMISLYSQVYKPFKRPMYKHVVYKTIEFMERELLSPQGGFYSAIDADSQGVEGYFYTFTKAEFDKILLDDAELGAMLFGVTASGNVNGRNALRVAATAKDASCVLRVDEESLGQRVEPIKQKLYDYRSTKVRPIIDDKQLASWNALAISGLVDAYMVFHEPHFLELALGTVRFIEEHLAFGNSSLYRVYCKEKKSVNAFLDDYAYLIDAYIKLYQATFDEVWLQKAHAYTQQVIKQFHCFKSGMFYYSNKETSDTIIRKMELVDGVLPSSGAVMAHNLLTLSVYFVNDDYYQMAKQMGANIINQVAHGGPYVYKWAHLLLNFELTPAQIIASGKEGKEKLNRIMASTHRPYVVPYLFTKGSTLPIATHGTNESSVSLCMAGTCRPSDNDVDKIIGILNKERLYK